jgi:tetratricopeptide (TPR) repeat protein
MLLGTALCSAQTGAIEAYQNTPNLETFRAAVNDLGATLAKDPGNYSNKLLMMELLNDQLGLLKDDLAGIADTLAAGERFGLANTLLGMGEYSAAIKVYNSLNRDYPKWSCPWRHKGQALFLINDFSAAEKSLEEAINTNSQHWDAYIWLAKVQKELGKYAEALANLDAASQIGQQEEGSEDPVFSSEEIRELYNELKTLAD